MHVNFDFQFDPPATLRQEQRFAITAARRVPPGRPGLRGLPDRRQSGRDVRADAQSRRRRRRRRHAVHHRSPGRTAEADRGRAGHGAQRRRDPLQRHRHAGRQLRFGHPAATTGALVGVHTNGGCNRDGPEATSVSASRRSSGCHRRCKRWSVRSTASSCRRGRRCTRPTTRSPSRSATETLTAFRIWWRSRRARRGRDRTEVHILSGASNFQQFILQTGTALHETDNSFAFAVTDWDGDGRPDLVAIKKSATGTQSTEVHILSGASNYQQFILQTGTALHETDDTFASQHELDGFGLCDQKSARDGSTECLLSARLQRSSSRPDGAAETDTRSLRSPTDGTAAGLGDQRARRDASPSASSRRSTTSVLLRPAACRDRRPFAFAFAHWNGAGRPDLVAIKKSATGTGSTEVHILYGGVELPAVHPPDRDGAARDRQLVRVRGHRLGRRRPADLVVNQKSATGTQSTEVHILSGASNYQQFILQTRNRTARDRRHVRLRRRGLGPQWPPRSHGHQAARDGTRIT